MEGNIVEDAFMQSPLFAALDAEGAAALRASLKETDVARGDVIFHEGEPGDRLYVVRSRQDQARPTLERRPREPAGGARPRRDVR